MFQIQQCEYEFADEIGVPLEYLEAGLMNDLTRETLEAYCRYAFTLWRQRHNFHYFDVVMKWVLHRIVPATAREKWVSKKLMVVFSSRQEVKRWKRDYFSQQVPFKCKLLTLLPIMSMILTREGWCCCLGDAVRGGGRVLSITESDITNPPPSFAGGNYSKKAK